MAYRTFNRIKDSTIKGIKHKHHKINHDLLLEELVRVVVGYINANGFGIIRDLNLGLQANGLSLIELNVELSRYDMLAVDVNEIDGIRHDIAIKGFDANRFPLELDKVFSLSDVLLNSSTLRNLRL